MSGYSKEELDGLRKFYRASLLDDTLRFWMPEIVDKEFGGYLSMRDQDGSLIDDDKSVVFEFLSGCICRPEYVFNSQFVKIHTIE